MGHLLVNMTCYRHSGGDRGWRWFSFPPVVDVSGRCRGALKRRLAEEEAVDDHGWDDGRTNERCCRREQNKIISGYGIRITGMLMIAVSDFSVSVTHDSSHRKVVTAFLKHS